MANKKFLLLKILTLTILPLFFLFMFLKPTFAYIGWQWEMSEDYTTLHINISGLDDTKKYSISSKSGTWYREGTNGTWVLTSQNGTIDMYVCNNQEDIVIINGETKRGPCTEPWTVNKRYDFYMIESGNSTRISEVFYFTPIVSNNLNFSMNPSNLSGQKTILKLEIFGGGIVPGWEYDLRLSGWKGDDIGDSGDFCSESVVNGNDWTANSAGRIIVENICDNGEACRNNCGETFGDNKNYYISVYEQSGKFIGSIVLKSEGPSGPGGVPNPKVTCPGGGEGYNTALGCIPTTINGFITTFLKVGLGTAGGIAFLMMVFGAIKILSSSGTPENINSGRELIISAVTGLLFIIFSVFLLRLIGIELFKFPIG